VARIGRFEKVADGVFAGSIDTLTVKRQDVAFARMAKASEKGPDYRIYAGQAELGVAFEKTAKKSGAVYLSVVLDDPSFPAPVNAKLVRIESAEGERYDLLWFRERSDD
jgi:uncharacterized protein (DUF736 family)